MCARVVFPTIAALRAVHGDFDVFETGLYFFFFYFQYEFWLLHATTENRARPEHVRMYEFGFYMIQSNCRLVF